MLASLHFLPWLGLTPQESSPSIPILKGRESLCLCALRAQPGLWRMDFFQKCPIAHVSILWLGLVMAEPDTSLLSHPKSSQGTGHGKVKVTVMVDIRTRWSVTPGLSQISVLKPKEWRERERGQEDRPPVGLVPYLDLPNHPLRGAELRVQQRSNPDLVCHWLYSLNFSFLIQKGGWITGLPSLCW